MFAKRQPRLLEPKYQKIEREVMDPSKKAVSFRDIFVSKIYKKKKIFHKVECITTIKRMRKLIFYSHVVRKDIQSVSSGDLNTVSRTSSMSQWALQQRCSANQNFRLNIVANNWKTAPRKWTQERKLLKDERKLGKEEISSELGATLSVLSVNRKSK